MSKPIVLDVLSSFPPSSASQGYRDTLFFAAKFIFFASYVPLNLKVSPKREREREEESGRTHDKTGSRGPVECQVVLERSRITLLCALLVNVYSDGDGLYIGDISWRDINQTPENQRKPERAHNDIKDICTRGMFLPVQRYKVSAQSSIEYPIQIPRRVPVRSFVFQSSVRRFLGPESLSRTWWTYATWLTKRGEKRTEPASPNNGERILLVFEARRGSPSG